MPAPNPKNFVLQGAPRAELARLCRQICLASEQGKLSPVTAEDEYLLALTTVRATYGTASANEDDLKDIVATEESRVADAVVLAELISFRLASAQAELAPPAASHATSSALPPTSSIAPEPSRTSASGGTVSPLSIADMLDGMLAQEKRDVRTASKH